MITLPKRARRATAAAGALIATLASLSLAPPAQAAPDRPSAVYGTSQTLLLLPDGMALDGSGACSAEDRTVVFDAVGICELAIFDVRQGTTLQEITIRVKPAPLTVTVDPASRFTGQADPEFTTTVTGWVNGDRPTALTGDPTFTALQYRGAKGVLRPTPLVSSPSSPAGNYIVRATGYTAPANYRLIYRAGRMTVARGAPMATARASYYYFPGSWRASVAYYNLRPFEQITISGESTLSTDPDVSFQDELRGLTADANGFASYEFFTGLGCNQFDKMTWTTTIADGTQLTAVADRTGTNVCD